MDNIQMDLLFNLSGIGSAVEPRDFLLTFRSPVFSSNAKFFLDGHIDSLGYGRSLYIRFSKGKDSPFTDEEREEQIRTCYGTENSVLLFQPPPEDISKVLEPSDSGEISEKILTEILLGGVEPRNTTLPPAMIQWLEGWLKETATLRGYLERAWRT